MCFAIDWMFVSPQNSYAEILTPRCDGPRRRGLWEVIRSCGWMTVPTETPQSSFPRSVRWGHRQKTAVYKPGIGPSPDTESAGPWSLTSASRTVGNKCLIFISPLVCGILSQQPKWTKTCFNTQHSGICTSLKNKPFFFLRWLLSKVRMLLIRKDRLCVFAKTLNAEIKLCADW